MPFDKLAQYAGNKDWEGFRKPAVISITTYKLAQHLFGEDVHITSLALLVDMLCGLPKEECRAHLLAVVKISDKITFAHPERDVTVGLTNVWADAVANAVNTATDNFLLPFFAEGAKVADYDSSNPAHVRVGLTQMKIFINCWIVRPIAQALATHLNMVVQGNTDTWPTKYAFKVDAWTADYLAYHTENRRLLSPGRYPTPAFTPRVDDSE